MSWWRIFVLISAFTFGNVSAGLSRLSPDFEQVASSLGARPAYRLWHVMLPLLAPYLAAPFGLSFALSMGELGATVMVYPPGWVTLPVSIFSLTDRGDIFAGAALTMIPGRRDPGPAARPRTHYAARDGILGLPRAIAWPFFPELSSGFATDTAMAFREATPASDTAPEVQGHRSLSWTILC
ncbi:ABC transporter permease subunit [Mesorhizobium argentiipisi]|uniref:ABC transporter permease subunit n=1 Tax=Mesorhizobium argentiipisi TaxID=3015175 RepID=A0ABU8KM00_9HYPH